MIRVFKRSTMKRDGERRVVVHLQFDIVFPEKVPIEGSLKGTWMVRAVDDGYERKVDWVG
jgi:hypothetical protein